MDAGSLEPPTVHATTLALGLSGRVLGLLLTGASGSGKSTLALTLIERALDAGRFARLVADDRTVLSAASGRLVARAPERLSGLIELRGLGIAPVEPVARCRVHAQAALVPNRAIERMPEPERIEWTADGISVSLARLDVPVGDPIQAARLIEHWLARDIAHEKTGS